MARTSSALFAAFLYIACSVWVVTSQGNAHREALRFAKRGNPPQAEVANVAKAKGAANPPPAPSQPPSRLQDKVGGTNATTVVDPMKPAAGSSPTPVTALASTAKPGSVPRDALPATESSTPAVDQWGDLSNLKSEEETLLGRQLHGLVMTYSLAYDSAPLQRIEELARPFLEARSRKEIEYDFTVLDSGDVFAFSHPGGYIYLSRGLVEMFGDDEDYALEFVLAHEIAHVDLKHAIDCLKASSQEEKKRGMGTLQQFYLLISFGYPPENEYAADVWTYQRMKKLDRTRRESLAFLRKFQDYAKTHKFEGGGKLPPAESKSPGVENHFRAQPAAFKRLAKLTALSATGTSMTPPASGSLK